MNITITHTRPPTAYEKAKITEAVRLGGALVITVVIGVPASTQAKFANRTMTRTDDGRAAVSISTRIRGLEGAPDEVAAEVEFLLDVMAAAAREVRPFYRVVFDADVGTNDLT
jgi:hypothetical protein